MIDISLEETFSLTAAAKRLPCRRGGKRTNVATIYRWSQVGCRGIRLETICIGAPRCTSMEALQRFFDALTAQAEPSPILTPPPAALSKSRQQQIEAAERRLASRNLRVPASNSRLRSDATSAVPGDFGTTVCHEKAREAQQ